MTLSANTEALLQRAGDGDGNAQAALFARHRERLRRIVNVRIDRRLNGRLDSSDVLQEAYVEFARSVTSYVRCPRIPLFFWLRLITTRKLQALHRRHLHTRRRTAHRDVSLYVEGAPNLEAASRDSGRWISRFSTPSEVAVSLEVRAQVQEALLRLDPIDREILVLRHFEMRSNREAAELLQLSETAASNRFIRALQRMKATLSEMPGLQPE